MNFFVLKNPKVKESSAVTDFLPTDGSRTGEAPRCPVCGRFIAMRPLLSPVAVEIETWGTMYGDIAFGPSNEILMAERLCTFFFTKGFTGLVDIGRAEVVECRKHKQISAPQPLYRCCRPITGKAAVDDAKSKLVRDKPSDCLECRLGGIIKSMDRLVLEAGTWSGEDIFFARGLPGTRIVSERVKILCENEGMSNCCFVPIAEFGIRK